MPWHCAMNKAGNDGWWAPSLDSFLAEPVSSSTVLYSVQYSKRCWIKKCRSLFLLCSSAPVRTLYTGVFWYTGNWYYSTCCTRNSEQCQIDIREVHIKTLYDIRYQVCAYQRYELYASTGTSSPLSIVSVARS